MQQQWYCSTQCTKWRKANEMQEYRAKVIRGAGRGKGLGFPTLNLAIPAKFEPEHGVYAGAVSWDGNQYWGAFHYGPIPTFENESPSLEVYVLDAEVNDPPKEITFQLTKYLRPIIKFETPEALAEQIQKDTELVRAVAQDS